MKKPYRLACLTLLILDLTACGGGSSSSLAPTLQVSFRAAASGNPIDADEIAALVTASDDYCTPFLGVPGAETQVCYSTPDSYGLGILGIYLVTCLDVAGDGVTCDSPDVDSIGTRETLYEGDQEDARFDASYSTFNADLAAASSDIVVGGIQVITSYLEQSFPDSGDEADKVMTALQGISYRICTTPDSESALMETRCGNAEAQMGDYLVDLDDDRTYGFLVVTDATTISETSSRPVSYAYNDAHFPNQEVTFTDHPENDYTTTDFYDVAGYFAPVMPVTSMPLVQASNDYSIAISLDIDNTFKWHDGADSGIPDADTCVQAISDTACATDDDLGSVGVYNPFYDTAFLPLMPEADVSINTVEYCADDSSCIIRLAYFDPGDDYEGTLTEVNNMYSAVSSDGLNFTVESLLYTDLGITDPDVFQDYGGQYIMLTSYSGSQLIKATSSTVNGTYTEDTSFSWSSGAISSTLEIAGRLYTFYTGGGGISYARYKSDGTLMAMGQALANPFSSGTIIGDPTVVELSDGTYMMFYKYAASGGGGPSGHSIYKATSADGFTYTSGSTSDYLIKTSASVPGAIRIGSTIYLYYVDGTQNTVAVTTSMDDGATFTDQTLSIFPSTTMFDPNPMAY